MEPQAPGIDSAGMRRYEAMVSVFSAMFHEMRPGTDGDLTRGDNRAWSIGAGRGKHDLMYQGSVVGDPPLATVHFGVKPRRITAGSGAEAIATVHGRTLDVTGPLLPAGRYSTRPTRRLLGLWESSTSFAADRDAEEVLRARETTHQRRTIRKFDVHMRDDVDPNIGLALILLFGAVRRQRVLGELFEHV